MCSCPKARQPAGRRHRWVLSSGGKHRSANMVTECDRLRRPRNAGSPTLSLLTAGPVDYAPRPERAVPAHAVDGTVSPFLRMGGIHVEYERCMKVKGAV